MNDDLTTRIEPAYQQPADHAAAVPAAPPQVTKTVTETYIPLVLGVGDGFRFGCGLFLAFVAALLAAGLLLAAVGLIATLLGVPLPGR